MTVHGLSGKDGRKWLRHRLRRWYERKLTTGELSEKSRSSEDKEKKMGLETSETTSSRPSNMMSLETTERAEQLLE